jgi:dTDP-4-amino-4,6-dideoxygalactose transaminase
MDMPETELAAKQALSLPVHPSLSQADLEKVVEVINAVASAGS